MSEWKEGTLAAVVAFGNGKSRPKTEGVYPVYGGNGILGYASEFNYDGETIVIGRVGAYCGATYYEERPIWVSDNALAAKPQQGSDAKYLYYLLKHLNLNQHAEGSSHPLVTQRLLNAIDITYSDDECEQKAIASVLSSLDDKIDLLHRQNKTLEAMAETLFRQWFVEEAQEDWEDGKVKDIVDVLSGFAFKSSVFVEAGTYRLITIKAVQDGYLEVNGAVQIEDVPSQTPGYCFLEHRDILLSLTGNVGRCCMVDAERLLLNQRVAKLRAKNERDWAFVYVMFRQQSMRQVLEEMGKGTAQSNLSPVEMSNMAMQVPPSDLLEKFSIEITPVLKRVHTNKIQIKTLEKLRDTLLPKLMSGEVRLDYEDCRCC